MTVLKQKTVSVGNQKQRIGLKQLKNDQAFGGRHKYEIVDLDTNSLLEDPFTDKGRAMKEFRATVDQIERGMKSSKRDSMDMGLGPTDSVFDPFEGEDLL